MPTLPEDLLLLALDDERGTYLTDRTTLDAAIAGAAVMELVTSAALEMDGEHLRAGDTAPARGRCVDGRV